MTRFRAAAILVAGVSLAACEKNAVQKLAGPIGDENIPAAQIRFFNFGLGAPGLNFYANTTKMTAISSATCSPTPADTVQQRLCRENGAEATTGVAYGGVGSGGLYAGIAPGDYTLKGTIAAATDKDLAVASLATTLAANKVYSFFTSGVYNTTAKTVDAFIVEDPLPAIDWANAQIRFVNASHNSSPMQLTVRDSTTKVETVIGSGTTAYKSAGTFTAIPGALYQLYTTVAGSATKVIQRDGVTFSAGRIYTVTARGDITVGGTAATARALDNTANR
jgi:hypothetical protein